MASASGPNPAQASDRVVARSASVEASVAQAGLRNDRLR